MKNAKFQITLPESTVKKLNHYSERTGLKISAAITNLLMLAFEIMQDKKERR